MSAHGKSTQLFLFLPFHNVDFRFMLESVGQAVSDLSCSDWTLCKIKNVGKCLKSPKMRSKSENRAVGAKKNRGFGGYFSDFSQKYPPLLIAIWVQGGYFCVEFMWYTDWYTDNKSLELQVLKFVGCTTGPVITDSFGGNARLSNSLVNQVGRVGAGVSVAG
jgi:hypothetical protein